MDCRLPVPATSPDRAGRLALGGFAATLLTGFAVPGLAAILLPLVVVSAGHRPFRVGEVVACQNWGMLTAPLFGLAADRIAGVRPMLVFGLALTAGAFAGLALERGLPALLASGLLLGMGTGATTMLALLLVTRTSTACDWGGRVAALQWLGAVGTVAGLATAGLVGARSGMLIACASLMPAMALAWPRGRGGVRVADRAMAGGGCAPTFATFLLAWFVVCVSIATFASLYPIVMERRFAVGVGASSLVMAAATLASLPLNKVAGRWEPVTALLAGAGLRCTALAGLAGLSLAHARNPVAALLCVALFQSVWPFLGVGSYSLAAMLSPGASGLALGLFAATGAAGSGVGALLAGSVADAFGYSDVFPAAATVAVVAFGCGMLLRSSGRDAVSSERAG